jgi:hypothetical protein
MNNLSRPEISQNVAQLNLASGLCAEAIARAIPKGTPPLALMPAPVGRKNGRLGPPKKLEPGELAALPAVPTDQKRNCCNESITGLRPNGKQQAVATRVEFLRDALRSKSFTDLVGEAALEALPGIQRQLLEEGVITQPIVPEALHQDPEPVEAIGCTVEFRLAFGAEGRTAPPSFAHFDRSDTFSRLAVCTLNVDNPATSGCLEKKNVRAVQFFTAAAFIKALLRDPGSALVQSLLAECKTATGLAPNQRLSTRALAEALAKSQLLEPIETLPIFGPASASVVGRSFALAEIDLQIPTAELGPPWNRNSSDRKGPNA